LASKADRTSADWKIPFLPLNGRSGTRQIIDTENNILAGNDDGFPFAGDRMLFVDIINTLASVCASMDRGI